ncbi:MAG: 5'-nucleotidase C-terminal domain-containing protein [Oscillospiraceae bacterium]|nr:5'-nucleotidase C-terminal domain-containing protein [Oscillospiraceae bacterium]
MKKCFTEITAVLFIVLLTFSMPSISVSGENGESAALTIIHVNDRHGRMNADPYISRLAEEITGNVLIFDAGDSLHGQITANLTRGGAMAELMNAVGYNAMVTGNHEFTFGIERLLELSELMNFPLLAANIKKDGETIFQPYEIFTLPDYKIGVFGIATPETVGASDPRLMTGLVFEDPAETAAAMVKILKAEGCDLIIALAHLGENKLSLPENTSEALAIDGVDIVIDGHSHTSLENGRTVNDTLIVQAGEYAQYIGLVEIIFEGGAAVSKTARLIKTDGEELAADEKIISKIAELDKSVEDVTSQIVGYTPVFLEGERSEVRTRDTNLANIIADSMRFASGAEIAFISGGSIRSSIPAGDITTGHVLTVLPYSNLLVTIEISGAVILEALEHGISLYPEPDGIYPQVSGLFAGFDPDREPGNRITGVSMPDGSPLDINKIYTVAIPEFLAVGGDGYVMFENGGNLVYYGGDADAFSAYLAANPPLSSEAEGRIRVKSENPKTGDALNFGMIFIAALSLPSLIFYLKRTKRHSASTTAK